VTLTAILADGNQRERAVVTLMWASNLKLHWCAGRGKNIVRGELPQFSGRGKKIMVKA